METTKEYVEHIQKMKTPFLEGLVAIVTGSSRGIGREMALSFAQLGAKVMVCYNKNKKEAEEACRDIRGKGKTCELFQGDLGVNAHAKALVEKTVSLFGGIDILVNNAGITDPRHFSALTEEDWDRLEKSNLKSAFNCVHHAIPYLEKSKMGRILNISSICGKSGGLGAGAHYCANKAGIIGFTKALANQYAAKGILVNAIAPAMIDTEMISWRTEAQMQSVVERIPLGRIGKKAEVAQAAAFLCSPFASFITGYTMDINGGLYMD